MRLNNIDDFHLLFKTFNILNMMPLKNLFYSLFYLDLTEIQRSYLIRIFLIFLKTSIKDSILYPSGIILPGF